MKKVFIIANYICRAVAFVCITVAAVKLDNAWLLGWYIVPLLMSPTIE